MNYSTIELLYMSDDRDVRCVEHSFKKKSIHWHTYYEMELVIKGSGKHIINGNQHEFRAGDIFLIRPSDFHEFELDDEGTTCLIEIPASYLSTDVVNLLLASNDDLIYHYEKEQFNIMLNFFYSIKEHCDKKGKLDSLLTNHMLNSLILLFVGNINDNFFEMTPNANNRLREIIFYIQKNFRQDITLESIASTFYISKGYLCSFFKSATGISISTYIRKFRLSYAARLVATTNLKSIEISESCGFNSVVTFLRSFKEEYNMSPLQMRKNAQSIKLLNEKIEN